LPVAHYYAMRKKTLDKEEVVAKIPWSLGRQILTYFYSGEAAKIFLEYSDIPKLKLELSQMRREISSYDVPFFIFGKLD